MNNRQLKSAISALLLLLSINTASYAKDEGPVWAQLVKQYHQTALDKFDAQDNLDAFKDYLTLYPDDALTQLYTGSSYCFIARNALIPWDKMVAAKTCIDKMEVALINAQQQYPENSSERLNSYITFGLTSSGLPAFFQQKEIALDTLSKAKAHPHFNYLPDDLQQKILDLLNTSN